MASSAALAAALVVALAGCGAEQGPEAEGEPAGDVPLAEVIALRRATWDASRPASYRMVLRHVCFCPPDAVGPVEVVVEGDEVTRRSYLGSGAAVDSSYAALFPPVAGLFDLLEEAVAGGADQVDVTWDPASGAPAQLFIDYDVGVADEERGYVMVEGPEPLPR